jgi:hypothetical protein
LNCLGTREELIRRFELFSFNSENMIPREDSLDLERFSETPLEKLAAMSWIGSSIVLYNETSPSLETAVPWKVVPELNYMSKKIASPDILKSLGCLMRPTFCFYN